MPYECYCQRRATTPEKACLSKSSSVGVLAHRDGPAGGLLLDSYREGGHQNVTTHTHTRSLAHKCTAKQQGKDCLETTLGGTNGEATAADRDHHLRPPATGPSRERVGARGPFLDPASQW